MSFLARLTRTSAVLVAAGLVLATPALAHKGGSSKSSKPALDVAAVTVTPEQAATAALTAAGGTGLLEMKLEAHKKGTRLEVVVATAAGARAVKLSITGDVLKVQRHRTRHAVMAVPPAGVTWATYAAAAPAGSSISKISMEHSTSRGDVVRVEYRDASGKKGKVRVQLDGSPLA